MKELILLLLLIGNLNSQKADISKSQPEVLPIEQKNYNIKEIEVGEEISRGEEETEEITDKYIAVNAIVTAYAPYDNKSGICNDGTSDTTATGTKPKYGTLAADPKRIPYGTQIYIEGYGFGVVEDTGSALRNDKENIRIDVFMDTYEEAIKWGRKEITICIKEGD